MRKPFFALLATAALGLAACSNAADPTLKAPGTYESSAKSTSASGTTTKTDQKTHVYRDASGDKRAVTETKTTTDPKGLFNKETSTTTKSYD